MLSLTKLVKSSKILLQSKLPASICNAEISSRKLEEKLGLPTKPKKPLTSYIRFINEKRSQVKKENPGLKMSAIVQKCAQQWTAADDKIKKKFSDEYAKDKEEYQKQLDRYSSQLTDEQKTSIEAIKRDLQINKEKRAHRKQLVEMGHPKKPRSPFLRFHHEQLSKKQLNVPDSAKANSELWRQLPEEKKKVYNETFKAEELTYRDKLAKWEAEMANSGQVHLVRKGKLLESVRKDALVDSPESEKKSKSRK